MTTPDLINGSFELTGAAMLALNVRQLWRDLRIAGVHWGPTLFFAAWGLWNLFYYPSLHQWASFAGGLAIVTMNLIWLVSLLIVSRRTHDDELARLGQEWRREFRRLNREGGA